MVRDAGLVEEPVKAGPIVIGEPECYQRLSNGASGKGEVMPEEKGPHPAEGTPLAKGRAVCLEQDPKSAEQRGNASGVLPHGI